MERRGGVLFTSRNHFICKKQMHCAAFNASVPSSGMVHKSIFVVIYRYFASNYRLHPQGPSSPRILLDP